MSDQKIIYINYLYIIHVYTIIKIMYLLLKLYIYSILFIQIQLYHRFHKLM
jgi:hypothetical protein